MYALRMLLSLLRIGLNYLLFHYSLNNSLSHLNICVLWDNYFVLNHHCFLLKNHFDRLLGDNAVELLRRDRRNGITANKDLYRLTGKYCLWRLDQKRSVMADVRFIWVWLMRTDKLFHWIRMMNNRSSFLFLGGRSWVLNRIIEIREGKRNLHWNFLDFIWSFDLYRPLNWNLVTFVHKNLIRFDKSKYSLLFVLLIRRVLVYWPVQVDHLLTWSWVLYVVFCLRRRLNLWSLFLRLILSVLIDLLLTLRFFLIWEILRNNIFSVIFLRNFFSLLFM